MSMTSWNDELDLKISNGFSQGLSARQVGEQIGKTRNAVLGRAFRLGLSVERPERTISLSVPVRIIKTSLPLTDEQIAERIQDARDLGVAWAKLGVEFGVDVATVRNWAQRLGVFQPSARMRLFNPEEVQYICDAWTRGDFVEDIAERLERSFGVIRQMILRLQRTGRITTRDPQKTRLLRQYGAAALSQGKTPREALQAMADAKKFAFAASVNAARAAKRKFRDAAMQSLREKLAAGHDRNAAIFDARAEGVTLEEIAEFFGVTRERVRQIVNAQAAKIAIASILA